MIDFEKLKTLRKKTEVSLALCRKALEESKNDLKKAEELLKQWGAEKISAKTGRKTAEGAFFSYVHHTKKVASLIELLCETDFVAKNESFQRLGSELVLQLATSQAKNVDELLEEEYIRDPSKKIKDLFNEAITKFGENIKIGRFLVWSLAK